MKIFLSWSGEESKQLANIFSDWLPNVLQFVEPYMSSNDISLGDRWASNIESNLEECIFGLVFVTPANINSPWINFEAGALSKTYKSKVVPLLYKSEIIILNDGPLKQFQSAQNIDKANILELLKSIVNSNESTTLDSSRLERGFEIWWPQLEEQLNTIVSVKVEPKEQTENAPMDSEMLKTIVMKLNQQEKDLRFIRDINSNVINNSEKIVRSRFEKKFAKDIHLGVIPDLKKVLELISTDDINLSLVDGSISEKVGYSKELLVNAIRYLESI